MKILHALTVLGLGLAFAQTEPVEIGKFRYFENSDPITDEDDSYLTLSEDATEYSSASLFFGCNDGALSSYVDPSGFLGIGEAVSVTYRFDSQEPSTLMRWNPSTGGDAAFVPEETLSEWVKQIRSGKKLAVRMTGYSDEELTSVFDLTGSTKALDRLPCVSAE